MLTQIEFGSYLRKLRENKNLSLRAVDEISDVTYSHLQLIESGKRSVTPALLKNLSAIYNVDYYTLYEMAGFKELVTPERTHLPVLGKIPAGIPIEMIQDVTDYEDISESMLKGGKEYFALKVTGDSMIPDYIEDDVIIVLKQDDCESGQDCVVAVNGDDATLKRVFKTDKGITLQPLNNSYMPMFYSNDDIDNIPIRILGVVKQVRRNK